MEQISFPSRGQTIHGWEHSPKTAWLAPAIVLCHGLTGNCEEHGLFSEFGKRACAAGFYVLRIDCAGSGESSGDFATETHLSGWRKDMLAALRFAAARRQIDAKHMGTLGISMGGATALLAAQSDMVRAAAGWAPVVYPAETFCKIMGEDNWARLKNGENIHNSYAGVTFDCAPQFARDAEQIPVAQAIEAMGKPLYLRFGTEDAVVDSAHGKKIAAMRLAHVDCKLLEGEDHSFHCYLDQNIDEAISFFKRYLMEG